MKPPFNAAANHERSLALVGWTPRKETKREAYGLLGFKCGLEIHQQLKTAQKLFCHCPAGIYHNLADKDAEIVRHMRPTLSELGEYDGTALMEFKTRKNIIYRIKNETTCTYDIDDTPPFKINKEALEIAIEISMLLKTNVVGELHVARKQYLDGSIPTGFQRTAIVGLEGSLPLSAKNVGVIQMSIEEDSCREVSDVGHVRTYTTDRLGMPLIETVTYPELLTPDEAAEAAHYIRFLCRSTGHVRTGDGATREDVNVSVTGGTRVEIKGIGHIPWIPELTHNEAFRQKALLDIAREIKGRGLAAADWKISHKEIDPVALNCAYPALRAAVGCKHKLIAVNLPRFQGLLSFFTQPGKTFANEIAERLKVIACLERPNMLHSEELRPILDADDLAFLLKSLKSGDDDAQILFWASDDDIKTALDTIEERCKLAFSGVPNETRKGFPDGSTIFERVLPGANRMYPDTDSAPVSITQASLDAIRSRLPIPVRQRMEQLAAWNVPEDTWPFLLKRNLLPLVERIVADFSQSPVFVATIFGHRIKHLEGGKHGHGRFNYERIYHVFQFTRERSLEAEIIPAMLEVLAEHPNMELGSVLTTIRHAKATKEEIIASINVLREKFACIIRTEREGAAADWIIGQLRTLALGNMRLRELRRAIEAGKPE